MKKIVSIACAMALTLAISASTFAAFARNMNNSAYANNSGYGCRGGMGYRFMLDEKGNLLSREEFEKVLDKEIADGFILSADKDYYLRMYDYCAENGVNFGRGGGCGGGRGMMGYRG